ncbi:MAG: hypothetical protein RDU14_15520 [Melioribacteraceae bacterium]|nr:hypothetical protein [Melioribacteraceae bacterium]
MNLKLSLLDKELKTFLAVYLIIIAIGVFIGLIYLSQTTSMTPKGTVERFNGSQTETDEFDLPDSYPKPISELLVSTHNHILGLSFIFFSAGLIFYFNSIVKGIIKTILMVEPLISIIITFGSIWLIRFVDPAFVYLTFLSSTLMYIGFYVIIFISVFDLLFKKMK